MIFSPQRNFCFIHVPKTGGTSIEHAYSQAVTFGDIILDGSSGTMSRFYLETLNLGRHASAAQIVDMIGLVAFQSMFSVAVVRDPVERMISYFRWIHSFNHRGSLERELSSIKDFDEFVDMTQEHLAPQVDFIFDEPGGEALIQLLIPYPQLREGWRLICDILKIPSDFPRLNESTYKMSTPSESSITKIHSRYAGDVALFQQASSRIFSGFDLYGSGLS
jgi:hypothetical protein